MGELHKKPTREELKANAAAALKEAEGMPADRPIDPPADSEPPTDPPKDPPAEDEPEGDKEPEGDTPPDDKADDKPDENTDYKQRYKDSSREAHRLAEKDKTVRKAVDDAAALPEPTEDELRTAYPKWEDMDENQQQLAKDNLLNKKRFDLIHAATNKTRALDEWEERVTSWATDPKIRNRMPDLEGKTDEFIAYASVKERVGNDLPTLVTAFLAYHEKNKGSKRGSMFPKAGGGGADPVKIDDGKLSVEEGRKLMKTDFPKFRQMLKDGKIRNE